MVKAFVTGFFICHTTNILSCCTFKTVHWIRASLSFRFVCFCCVHGNTSDLICQYYFHILFKLFFYLNFIVWIFWQFIFAIKKAGDGNRTHVSSLEGWCSTIELHPHVDNIIYKRLSTLKKRCPEPESNQRHRDFQSLALPTELSGLAILYSCFSARMLYYHAVFWLSTTFFNFFILTSLPILPLHLNSLRSWWTW